MKTIMFLKVTNRSFKPLSYIYIRGFSLWSMKKDPDLESALSHNRRWIVNNQIKNIILRYPNQVAPVSFIQKKFKTLDLQGKALNWLNKYPCCFEVFRENDELYCQLTKNMMCLVEEEESIKEQQEPVFAERLAKILMMSSNQRLNVVKLDELKRSFGFPDDYLIRIIPKYPEMFRLINYSGRKSSLEVELISWDSELATSYIEMSARKQNTKPGFSCLMPSTWIKSWEKFDEFNSTPYISPYTSSSTFVEGSKEHEKRTVALMHEVLSMTLWKKLSIMKLGHFKREFALPEKLNVLLLKHRGIFYVTNKYKKYTVLLREGYIGSKLVNKDPLVVVKDKFGELMQEGLHEYNQRRRLLNIEKRKKGIITPTLEKKDRNVDIFEEEDKVGQFRRIYNPEERKRLRRRFFLLRSTRESSSLYQKENKNDAPYRNKCIENWEDICTLFGADTAVGDGLEQHDEAAYVMEGDIVSEGRSSSKDPTNSGSCKRKKDSVAEAVNSFVESFREYVQSKIKDTPRPTCQEIYVVVSQVFGISRSQIMGAVKRFMNGNPDEFLMLKDLPEDEKLEWVLLCLAE
ncbi:Protein WHAT'S THIS FACTOR 1-like protein [Bienertia sinuspersici]